MGQDLVGAVRNLQLPDAPAAGIRRISCCRFRFVSILVASRPARFLGRALAAGPKFPNNTHASNVPFSRSPLPAARFEMLPTYGRPTYRA